MKLGNPLRSILAAAIMAAGLVFGASGGAQAQWLDFPDITKTGEILSNALRIPGLDGVGGIADGGFRDSQMDKSFRSLLMVSQLTAMVIQRSCWLERPKMTKERSTLP